MKNTLHHLVVSSALLLLPAVALAAPRTFKEFMLQLIAIVDAATLMLFGFAMVIFFWNVAYNLWGYDGGNAEKREKLNTALFWGVIIIFVMVSIWGIIQILQQTLVRGLS